MGIEVRERAITGIKHYDIRHGKKVLELDINIDRRTASLRFGNSPDILRAKKPHETTIAFIEVDGIMQQTTDSESKPIILSFDSANTNLKTWMKKHREQFGFTIKPDKENAYRETVTKIYSPRTTV